MGINKLNILGKALNMRMGGHSTPSRIPVKFKNSSTPKVTPPKMSTSGTNPAREITKMRMERAFKNTADYGRIK